MKKNKGIIKKVFIIIAAYFIFNLLVCLFIYIYVEEYLLYILFANMLFYFIINKTNKSKESSIFISVLMTIIAGLTGLNFYNNVRSRMLTKNNFSLLGVVEQIKKGGRSLQSYYILTITYSKQVDNYSSNQYKVDSDIYDKKIKAKIGDTVVLHKYFNKNYCQVISWHPSPDTLQLFQKPVKYLDGEEIGNDYYYYARLRTHNALKNFGLNVVFKGLYHADTVLYCRNINSSIDSVTHPLADTLQTAANRALVGSSFAFLFHDGIYTKEQVFKEIPQAREYYLKYCKETENETDTTSNTP